MLWATRDQIRVGRMGCAWLIMRFVDQEAEFLFLPGKQAQAEAARLGATLFHAEGAALNRQGSVSSFEVVLRHFSLETDPALALLGQIVNTADITTSPYQRPEGAGLRAIADGITAQYGDDLARNQAGMVVYDALYAYCQAAVRRGGA